MVSTMMNYQRWNYLMKLASILTTENDQLAKSQACHEFMDEAGKSVALVMEKINVCQLINNRKVAKTCLGSKNKQTKKQRKRASLFCLYASKTINEYKNVNQNLEINILN